MVGGMSLSVMRHAGAAAVLGAIAGLGGLGIVGGYWAVAAALVMVANDLANDGGPKPTV